MSVNKEIIQRALTADEETAVFGRDRRKCSGCGTKLHTVDGRRTGRCRVCAALPDGPQPTVTAHTVHEPTVRREKTFIPNGTDGDWTADRIWRLHSEIDAEPIVSEKLRIAGIAVFSLGGVARKILAGREKAGDVSGIEAARALVALVMERSERRRARKKE